jgi:hypothetical protein
MFGPVLSMSYQEFLEKNKDTVNIKPQPKEQ